MGEGHAKGRHRLAAVALVLISPPVGVERGGAVMDVDTTAADSIAAPKTAADSEVSSKWPVLVGGAFFLYLWWFSALLFDLVFVWHRNIRHGATDRVMATLGRHATGDEPGVAK